jgi:hypothetical protein
MTNLVGPRVITDQPQRGLQVQSCGEQPVEYDLIQALGDAVAIFGQVMGRSHRTD